MFTIPEFTSQLPLVPDPQLLGRGTKYRHNQQVTENQGFYQIKKCNGAAYQNKHAAWLIRSKVYFARVTRLCDMQLFTNAVLRRNLTNLPIVVVTVIQKKIEL